MNIANKIAVKEREAARLLSLTADEFADLVEAGALPPPVLIRHHRRWPVADLIAILSGAKIEDEFET